MTTLLRIMTWLDRLYESFCLFFQHRIPWLYRLGERYKSFVKFFIAGCFAGFSNILFLFLFHGVCHLDIVFSTSLSFILSFLVSFAFQKLWAFQDHSHDRVVHQLFVYLLNALLGLFLNGYFMHILVNQLRIWYILSQIIVNLALAAWNFFVYKFIVFKNKKDENNSQPTTIS